MKRLALLALLAAISGCAYYNGMYNANRLARAAEKAEREGRTFEAANLWGQVGVKADTMLARHSGSKWADDARLLRGKSYQRLGDCNSAVTVLRELISTSTDSVLTEEAAFLMGRCHQAQGNTAEAAEAFARLVDSKNPTRRQEARYNYGRSLRQSGRYDEALKMLDQNQDPHASGERTAALAGLGRLDEAIAVSDSLIARGDTTAPWDSILVSVGRHDPARASALTDRLVAMPQASASHRAMWLLADAQRIAPRDPERAARRATEASMISDGDVAPQSRLLLLQFRMGRIDSVDSLRAIRIDLDDLLQSGGPTGIVLSRYLRASDFVLEIVDSVAQGAGNPDLRLFLAAEATRDSLEMTRLARQFFQRIAEEHQASPYAAKALLAVAAIDSSAADSTESLLAARYPDSPYYLAARGQDAPGFTALEDSLLRFANSLRRANRPATQPRPQTPTSPGVRVPQ